MASRAEWTPDLTDADLIEELDVLARASADAADRSGSISQLAESYKRLRADAAELNDQNGWATPEEFESQLPPLEALRVIESLDDALVAEPGSSRPARHGASVGLVDALVQLSSWAVGVRLAYETLRGMSAD